MNLHELFLTENGCYKSGKKHTVKGIMVHSTGANNPNLKRYIGPDDGLLGVNQYGNHWNTAKPGGREICVHAFIGKLADNTIATYQTLPWDMVGWHSGSGSLGRAKNANNNGYIGFEICEDALADPAYFSAAYKEATELCAYLCVMFNLDPLADGIVVGHCEGHQLGIASNHGDPHNWFPKFGKSMDTMRSDIAELLDMKPSPTPLIGSIVNFIGAIHYRSSGTSKGYSCKPGAATLTRIEKGAKHPYHLINVKGGGSNVYGWVDAADVIDMVDEPVQPDPNSPKTLDGFITHLEEEYTNHSIYVWGAQGQGKSTISEGWIRSRETSEKNANRAIAYWQAQVAAGYGDVLKAFDCSGLGMAYLQNEAEIVGSDMNANGMMSKCAKLNRQQLRRGDWVFKVYTAGDDAGRAYHIGYVVDNELNVIEAKGRDVGVVKRHVDAGGWNAYGRPSYFKDEIEEQPDIGPRDLKLASPMMRGEDVEALQKKLMAIGYDLGKFGPDGVYGNDTDAAVKLFQQRAAGMVAGVCDEAMRAALNL